MAQIITRLYASASSAASAVKTLKDSRFADGEVCMVSPTAGATAEQTAASVAQTGVGKATAEALAESVAKGNTLVVVHAPFGAAAKAINVLDRYEPLPTPTAVSKAASPASAMPAFNYEDAAPLSSMMQWKTKLDDPTPLSTMWKFPTLSDFSLSKKFGMSELSDEAAPLSKRFGWQVLHDDPTPLSNKFKWPVLRD